MTGCLWPCAAVTVTAAAVAAGSGAGRKGGGMFRSKAKSPAEVVRHGRDLLVYITENDEARSGKCDTKGDRKILTMMTDHARPGLNDSDEGSRGVFSYNPALYFHTRWTTAQLTDISKSIRDMKCILYGNGEAEPIAEACIQLTKEFSKENTHTLRLLIVCLPYLDLEAQKDVTQVVANLQRRKLGSRMVASDYLEANQDLLDILMSGYANMEIAIHYSTILRDCIRHQVAARYILNSKHMKKFFEYIQFPDFNIASDAFKTFKELLTRHKSSVAEFFSRHYEWFFGEFNSKLLSSNYIIRRQAIQLLGDILMERSNMAVMVLYVSSKDHLIILMNLLREQSKAIQVEAFHVFKLFAANQNKPPEIVGILVTNKNKLIRFIADFTLDKEDMQFEADKAQVIAEISAL